MARERDITRRAKFFTRKKNCNEDALCKVCRHHKYIVIVKLGCDAIMTTNIDLKNGYWGMAVDNTKFIHSWCLREDDPPACLEQFIAARPVA